jgi:hypothetical protein
MRLVGIHEYVAGLFLEVAVNANSKEIHPMCRLDLIYTPDELKALDKKSKEALKKRGKKLVETSFAIRNIIKRDPKVCKKLKVLLRPEYSRLKRE